MREKTISHYCPFKGTVLSDQIRSAWEWYHWIGIDKDINCYRFWFLILILNIWKDFKKVSEPLYVKSLLLLPHTVFKDPFFILAGALLFDEKILQRVAHLVWIAGMLEFFKFTSRPTKNNCWLCRIFGARLGGKDWGSCPYNRSAEDVGGLDGFLHEAAQNFEAFQVSKVKIKKSKP